MAGIRQIDLRKHSVLQCLLDNVNAVSRFAHHEFLVPTLK